MRQILEVSGDLKTDEDVRIGSRIAGRVARVNAKEGDRVTRGQVLVQLDDRELRAQIDRAKGVLSGARAKLSLARNQRVWKDTSAQSDFDRAKADVRAAKARVQQAETTAKMVEVQTKTEVETAQSGVNVATERLTIARDLTRRQELRQAQLAVDQAQTQVAQAKVDLENARSVFERRDMLFKKDAISREEVDEAERRFKSAQAELKVIEAGAAVAAQKLELAKEGTRPEEVRVAEETLRSAQDTLAQAKANQSKKRVAEDNVTAARSALEQAEAQLRSAEAGLTQTKMSEDEIRSAAATVAQAQADIAVYQTQLDDLTIRAPVSGVVSTRQVNAGETVTTGTQLMNLVALDTVYLEAQVPELDVSLLRPGTAARVTIDSLPGRTFGATVRELIPVAERSSKIFRVRVAVLGSREGRLPAGGHARAMVAVGTHASAVVLRKDAVLTESGENYVWLLARGEGGASAAKRQAITVGLVDDRYVEITSGVQPGDEVILAGSPAIIDGTPVSVGSRQ